MVEWILLHRFGPKSHNNEHWKDPGCTLALTVLVLGSQKLNAQDNGLLLDCECPLVRMDNAYCAATWVFEGIPLSADTIFSTSTGVDARINPLLVWISVRCATMVEGDRSQEGRYCCFVRGMSVHSFWILEPGIWYLPTMTKSSWLRTVAL